MPSSVATGPKFRALQGGGKYRIVPDFIDQRAYAAADMTGANSGVLVFQVPKNVRGAVFLGISESHGTAGTGTFRVQKLTSTGAAGAAASATAVDMTAAIAVNGAANTVQDIVPITTGATATIPPANYLNPGDRVALASAAGLATVAAGFVILRFGWL